MPIPFVNPINQELLVEKGECFEDNRGNTFPIINGIPRFVESDNYTNSFGFQWNTFAKTQIDDKNQNQSKTRFAAVTHWDKEDLSGMNVLEVGSGAGRFSKIVLEYTRANLYSVDYSSAVEANRHNNNQHTKSGRFVLAQASIYELPFPKKSFDKVFCFGVLQHTPNFKKSIQCLTEMVKPGGELIVDFYPIKGWYTKIHAKYIFRPITKSMGHEKLLRVIQNNADWLIGLSNFFTKIGIGKIINRFIPICDITNTLPPNLTPQQRKEWVVLDTFDMFSPQYDKPQKLSTVKQWVEQMGMVQVKADFIRYEENNQVAVVKAIAP